MNPEQGFDGRRPFRELQLRLFPLRDVPVTVVLDEPQLYQWGLRDIRALAIDLDVEMRRMVAQTRWVIDADLQNVLATDPDEQVVLNLLSVVDPHREAVQRIFAGPHREARRLLARRNLTTATLLTVVDDHDEAVRDAALATLMWRGVPIPTSA